jgi:hypothetical protein
MKSSRVLPMIGRQRHYVKSLHCYLRFDSIQCFNPTYKLMAEPLNDHTKIPMECISFLLIRFRRLRQEYQQILSINTCLNNNILEPTDDSIANLPLRQYTSSIENSFKCDSCYRSASYNSKISMPRQLHPTNQLYCVLFA